MGQREADSVILILEGMAAVVEVGADFRRTPWRLGHKLAEIQVAELDLTRPRELRQDSVQSLGGAVELGKIVTGINPRVRISGRRADQARAFVASAP